MLTKPAILITGASTGIDATYADRFARRGHDLVLVARDKARMEAIASRLTQESVVAIDILPAATRTELWSRAGADETKLPPMMDVNDLVDAALAGFDQREAVTIPPLHDAGLRDALDGARRATLPSSQSIQPALR